MSAGDPDKRDNSTELTAAIRARIAIPEVMMAPVSWTWSTGSTGITTWIKNWKL
jgi:hypothetical protein